MGPADSTTYRSIKSPTGISYTQRFSILAVNGSVVKFVDLVRRWIRIEFTRGIIVRRVFIANLKAGIKRDELRQL